MQLIIGLGNYPVKYKNTRHNFGFLAIDEVAKKFNFSPWLVEKKFFAEITRGEINGEKTILCKPQTLMNLSGKSVCTLTQFYKIPTKNIIVFSDDLDIEFGKSRRREKGSAGGQRGLKDIIQCLGSDHFVRIKFGINAPHRSQIPTENFVLSKFLPEEEKQIPQIIQKGIEKIMKK